MLKASPAGLQNPLFALFGETGAKVVQSAFAAAMVVFPEQSAEKTSGPEVGLDIEYIQENDENPHSNIEQPVLNGVVLSLLLLLLRHRVGHSP
jgi:hypothetical protein